MNDTSKLPRYMLIAAAILLLAVTGYKIWTGTGTMDEPDMILNGSTANPADSITILEDQATKTPDNAGIWQQLGWAYFDNGRFDDAVTAYENAVKLAPKRAISWSSLGEALVMADERNPMPADASAAFRKAYALNPGDPRARYFLAVEKDLAGDHEGAISDWIALLGDTEQNAPWERDLIRTIEQVGKINNIDISARLADVENIRKLGNAGKNSSDIATAAIPGPNRSDMANAAKLSPGQQTEMIASMVNSLEQKLEKDPANIDGWIMLMRSRMTLGEEIKAQNAYQRAIAANPVQRGRITKEARILQVPGL